MGPCGSPRERAAWATEGAGGESQLGRGAGAGPGGEGSGLRAGEGKEGVGRVGEEASWADRVRVLGWVFLLLSFSFFFSFQTPLKLFEFKSNLNSNSYALKQTMHQHECTNKLALK